MVNYPTAPAFSQRVIPRLTGQALGEDPFHKREPHVGDKNGWTGRTDSTLRFSLARLLTRTHRQADKQKGFHLLKCHFMSQPTPVGKSSVLA